MSDEGGRWRGPERQGGTGRRGRRTEWKRERTGRSPDTHRVSVFCYLDHMTPGTSVKHEKYTEESERGENTLLHKDNDLSTNRLFRKSVPDDKHSNARERERETETETDRDRERQTDRQTDRQTETERVHPVVGRGKGG